MPLPVRQHIRTKGVVKVEEHRSPSIYFSAEAMERIVAPSVIVQVDHLIHRKICCYQAVRIGHRLWSNGRTCKDDRVGHCDRHNVLLCTYIYSRQIS